jgi:hypothetical protein
MGKDSHMTNWNQMSITEQREYVRYLFEHGLSRGILKNKGRRPALALKSTIEKVHGITITMNAEVWQSFVDQSIPSTVETAADRAERQAAEMAASLGL